MTGEPLAQGHGRASGQQLIICSYVQKYTGLQVSTLFKFADAVSPHVAARGARDLVSCGTGFWQ
jgi:hypothetical protein